MTDSSNQRAALVEFMEIAVNYYGEPQIANKVDLILPSLRNCLVFSQQMELGPRESATPDPAFLSVISIPRVPMADWKLSYLSLRVIERLVGLLSLDSLHSLATASEPTGQSFVCLWKFAVAEGIKSSHPWIRLSSIRVLGQMLVKLNPSTSQESCQNSVQQSDGISDCGMSKIEKKRKSRIINICKSLLSRSVLPELGVMKSKKNRGGEDITSAVTPLVCLMSSLGQWSREPDAEKNPALSHPFVQLMVLICRVLLSTPILSGECEDVEVPEHMRQGEGNSGPNDGEGDVDNANCEDTFGQVEQQGGEKNHMMRWNGGDSENVDDNMGKATEEIVDGVSSFCFDITSDQEDVDVDDEDSEDGVMDDTGNGDVTLDVGDEDDEEMLFDFGATAPPDSLEQQTRSIANPESAEDDLTSPMTEFVIEESDVETDFLSIDAVLRKTRIRWLVGRLSWSIRRDVGDVVPNAVRLCIAIRLFGQLISVLPAVCLKADQKGNLLKPILESVYLCAGMNDDNATPDASQMKSLEIDIVGKSPRKAMAMLSQLASESLSLIERNLTQRNLESDFTAVLKDVRMVSFM